SLPAPEGECCQLVTEQTRLTGTLHHIIGRSKQRTATERENHRVRVQRAQTTIAEPWNVKVQLRPDQLCGNPHTDSHADNSPNYGHDGELSHRDGVEDFRLFSERIGSTHELPLKY